MNREEALRAVYPPLDSARQRAAVDEHILEQPGEF